jgi:hypothetical protein
MCGSNKHLPDKALLPDKVPATLSFLPLMRGAMMSRNLRNQQPAINNQQPTTNNQQRGY